MVRAVLAHDVVDDLLPPLVTEIDVEVGHTDPLGVQKPLEEQVVADGIDAGDADAVGGEASRARTAPRPHRDADRFCVVDEVEDDEVVVDVPHLDDHVQLVLQPFRDGRFGLIAVVAAQALVAEALEVGEVVLPARRDKERELGIAELELDVAHLRNFEGVVERAGVVLEERGHLVTALDVEFLRLKFEVARLVHRGVRLDADQHALHPGVRPLDVVGVVGGDEADARLLGEPQQVGQNLLLKPDAVVLDLDVIVSLAEDVLVPERRLLRAVVIPRGEHPGDLPREAGRQTDEPPRDTPRAGRDRRAAWSRSPRRTRRTPS